VPAERVASQSAETNHLAELTKTSISILKEHLKSPDYMARVGALIGFRDSPTTLTEAENPNLAEGVPILLQAAKDTNSMVRTFAVDALWHIRSPEAEVVKALGNLVAHETDVNVACTAATALKDLGPAAAPAVPDLMDDLVKRDDHDGTFIDLRDGIVEPKEASSGSLLRAVIEALGNIGPPAQEAVPLLRKRLHDTGRESLINRVFSAKAIWQITGETNETVAVLVHALQTDNSFWAAEILGVMGTAANPAVPALQAKVETGDAYIRLYSAIALNKIEPDFQLRPILLDSLNDSGTGTRLVAAQNIWKLYHDSQAILPTLIDFLKPDDHAPLHMRQMDFNAYAQTAIRFLGEIGPPAKAAVPRLEEIVKDKDSPNSSRMAAKALEKIQGNSSGNLVRQ
jgi:HEAT repeats